MRDSLALGVKDYQKDLVTPRWLISIKAPSTPTGIEIVQPTRKSWGVKNFYNLVYKPVMAILFYSPNDSYGCFSNFSRHEVQIYGHTWKTSEAAFQAMKFHPHRPDLVKLVLDAETPGTAARLGRNRSYPLRKDWDLAPNGALQTLLSQKPQPDDGINRCGVTAEPLFARTKDVVMFEVVRAKVTQHQSIYDILIGTGTEPLIEDAIPDPYWGWGSSKVGENKLGRILMYLRTQLLNQP